MGLRSYVLRRLGLMIIVLWGLITITFIVSHVIPVDPVALWAGEKARMQELDIIRKRYHLDEPLWRQYIYFFQDLLQGNLGISPVTNRPVLQDLTYFFPATFELALLSLTIVMALGILFGVFSALKRGSITDHLLRIYSLTGTSMPIFWLGVILQFVLYYSLDWLPLGGRIDAQWTRITGFVLLDTLIAGNLHGFLDAFKHMIMPAFCLSFSSMGLVVRITRSSMLEVLGADYIRTAKSKGLPKNVVIYKHALKNALIPPLTALAWTFGNLLQGAMITETVFSWPGMGNYAASAIYTLDFPAVMGFTVLAGISVVVVNFITDLLYLFIDPRIRMLEAA